MNMNVSTPIYTTDKDKDFLDGADVIFTSVTSKNTTLNVELQSQQSGVDVFSE
jgi:hypothetical protein